MLPDSPVTVTLTPEALSYLGLAAAALGYPMWGAITAGLWGRYLAYSKPLNPDEKWGMSLAAVTWPVSLPLLFSIRGLNAVYGPVARAFLKDYDPKV